jgi:hypothetical protein
VFSFDAENMTLRPQSWLLRSTVFARTWVPLAASIPIRSIASASVWAKCAISLGACVSDVAMRQIRDQILP